MSIFILICRIVAQLQSSMLSLPESYSVVHWRYFPWLPSPAARVPWWCRRSVGPDVVSSFFSASLFSKSQFPFKKSFPLWACAFHSASMPTEAIFSVSRSASFRILRQTSAQYKARTEVNELFLYSLIFNPSKSFKTFNFIFGSPSNFYSRNTMILLSTSLRVIDFMLFIIMIFWNRLLCIGTIERRRHICAKNPCPAGCHRILTVLVSGEKLLPSRGWKVLNSWIKNCSALKNSQINP